MKYEVFLSADAEGDLLDGGMLQITTPLKVPTGFLTVYKKRV